MLIPTFSRSRIFSLPFSAEPICHGRDAEIIALGTTKRISAFVCYALLNHNEKKMMRVEEGE